jgi:hypothetical protein
MPASSVESMFSWAAYLAASAGLLIALAPPVHAAYQGSVLVAEERVISGVDGVFDSLRPGLEVNFTIGGSLPPGELTLSGHYISYNQGGEAASVSCRWTLPSMELSQGEKYTAWLAGEQVQVVADGVG